VLSDIAQVLDPALAGWDDFASPDFFVSDESLPEDLPAEESLLEELEDESWPAEESFLSAEAEPSPEPDEPFVLAPLSSIATDALRLSVR
jgi:hypothetical protein